MIREKGRGMVDVSVGRWGTRRKGDNLPNSYHFGMFTIFSGSACIVHRIFK